MADKAIYTRQEAWAYVGSRPFFEQLQQAYPEILKPIRQCGSTGAKADGSPREGKTEYFKEVIDTALRAAQMEQRFVTSSK